MSPTLAERLTALESALAAGQNRFDAALLERGHAVVERASARTALSAEHTVIALAGSTGSGKSSLVNALVGQEVAITGVRRPTTSSPVAAVWGPGAEPLLDWLEVTERHRVTGPVPEQARGLVVLDLPDHDSVQLEHRTIAERLVERVDLLVWVVDPQKYADHALHEQFLRPLALHADRMVLLLNQIDRLTERDALACRTDLARLAAADGLDHVLVLGTSARTGEGINELREQLVEAAARREAAVARLVTDVRAVAEELLVACGPAPRRHDEAAADAALTAALGSAAGVDEIVSAVAGRARQRARAATGWPITRWLGKFRPDPLRRLNLHQGAEEGEFVRTSLPAPGPAREAQTHIALRTYAQSVTAGVEDQWSRAARDRVAQDTATLTEDLDQAVARTELEADRKPRWWRAVNVWQWFLCAILIAGLVWLGMLAVFSYFRLPQPPTPDWRDIPWPTLLVIVGAVLGLMTSFVSRAVSVVGARRQAARARRRLEAAIDEVATRVVRTPVREELDALTRCRDGALAAAKR